MVSSNLQRRLRAALVQDDEEGLFALVNLTDPRATRQLLLSASALNMSRVARVILDHEPIDTHALQTICCHGRVEWLPFVKPAPPHSIWGHALETAARHNQWKACQWMIAHNPSPEHLHNALQWALIFGHEQSASILAPHANVAEVLERIRQWDPQVLHQLSGSPTLTLVQEWEMRLKAQITHKKLHQSVAMDNINAIDGSLSKM